MAGWKSGRPRAPSDRFGGWRSFATCVSLCGFLGRANASELVIGRAALQKLIEASVFKDQGRWYLAKGKCYAYLERPHVALGAGRVIIDAHLSSLLGLSVGGSCVGTEMMSDVQGVREARRLRFATSRSMTSASTMSRTSPRVR